MLSVYSVCVLFPFCVLYVRLSFCVLYVKLSFCVLYVRLLMRPPVNSVCECLYKKDHKWFVVTPLITHHTKINKQDKQTNKTNFDTQQTNRLCVCVCVCVCVCMCMYVLSA